MLTGKLNRKIYFDVNEKIQYVLDFLAKQTPDDVVAGKTAELDYGIRVFYQEYTTNPYEDVTYEVHQNCWDIQFVLSGQEHVHVFDTQAAVSKGNYDSENDVEFFENPTVETKVLLNAGEYVILTPNDVHKPRITAQEVSQVKKLVVKIPM